jgi:hypothetical protein
LMQWLLPPEASYRHKAPISEHPVVGLNECIQCSM